MVISLIMIYRESVCAVLALRFSTAGEIQDQKVSRKGHGHVSSCVKAKYLMTVFKRANQLMQNTTLNCGGIESRNKKGSCRKVLPFYGAMLTGLARLWLFLRTWLQYYIVYMFLSNFPLSQAKIFFKIPHIYNKLAFKLKICFQKVHTRRYL